MTNFMNVLPRDGRDQSGNPELDKIRSQVGGYGNAAGGAGVTLYTVPAGKVLHIGTLIVSKSTPTTSATAWIRASVAATTRTLVGLKFGRSSLAAAGDSHGGSQTFAATKLQGIVVVASTVTPVYIRGVSVGVNGRIFYRMGGLLRNRVDNDTTIA